MDGKKEFVIQINGVKESVTEVDELLLRLSNLQERLDKLQGATISVNVDATEFPKVLPTSEADNPPTATTVEIEKQLEVAKELNLVRKQIAQGVRDENGEYTNTLKGLRTQLSEMKKQLSLTELGTSAFDEMNKKVGSLNSEVKKLEQSYGDFQRNVGNYASAAEGFNKLTVTIGGVEKSFESLRAANKELQNEMNGIALRMKELQDSGQGASKEFEELSSKFEEIAKASESLDKASAYADRMKESIQDDSGAIGEMSRSFEAFNAVANIGVGVLGLFGSETEDLQKNINRTIQVTTVLKGIQELYNSQLQKGAPLMKVYQGAVNLVEKALYRKAAAQTADVAATNAATTATHTFSKALVATGVGAIVVAIGLLIANLDTLSEWFTKLVGGADNLSKGLDKIKEVASGVGNAIVNFIVQPFKTSMAVIKKIMEGDLKGAVTEYTEGIKKQVNVVAAYQEGAQKQAEKNQENHNKEMAKKRAKDTQNAIEENEAKYGSDWKYTEEANELYQQMFADRLSMYDKDSEEYRQANNEKLAYDREYAKKQSENAQKAAQEAEKKRQDSIKAAQDYQKKLDEINERIYKNELELISDTYEKKKRELEHQREKELKEAKDSAEKVNEQVAAINKKFNAEQARLNEKHQQDLLKQEQTYQANRNKIAETANSLSLLSINNTRDLHQWRAEMESAINEGLIEPLDVGFARFQQMGQKRLTAALNAIGENFVTNTNSIFGQVQKFYSDSGKVLEGESEKNLQEVKSFIANSLKIVSENTKTFLDNEKDKLFDSSSQNIQELKKTLEELYNITKDVTLDTAADTFANFGDSVEDFEDSFKKVLEDMDKKLEQTANQLAKAPNEKASKFYQGTLETLLKERKDLEDNVNSLKNLFEKTTDTIFETQQKAYQNSLKKASEANIAINNEYKNSFATTYESLNKMAEKYTKDINSINPFENIANLSDNSKVINSLSQEYKMLSQAIGIVIKDIDKEIEENKKERFEIWDNITALNEFIEVRSRLDELDKIGTSNFTDKEIEEWNSLIKKAEEFEEKLKDVEGFDPIDSIKGLESLKKGLEDNVTALENAEKNNNKYKSSLLDLIENIEQFQKGTKVSWKEWALSIVDAFDFVGSAASSIISDIADTMYNNATAAIEAQLDALEKETEAYEDKYQEDYDALEESLRAQEDLVAEHNDIINGLEGELASARGDRRLEVLDAITSEKAEREKALQKQKQLEKQREQMEKQKAEFDKQQEEKKLALEKQMDEEEMKRKKLQKIAQTVQAVVNTSVGVTQALASGPPWVSIPLAAIVGAMGAAEIAMINSQKYADGGLLVGNSHQNGGVKVLGGQAEVEGGEYITNKRTTKYNLELLDFINSQNGRIDESDILEFFNKRQTPRYSFNQTVFASGGQLPSLSNPQSINQQRIIKTMNMDDRPIVVSVQEIVDTADNMRNVRVLSGEDDDWNL